MSHVNRMPSTTAVSVLLAVAVLARCGSVSTIDSPFDLDTAVEDDRVLGDWSTEPELDADPECCITLLREGSVYRILPHEEGEGAYVGRLLEVGGTLFIDTWPDLDDTGGPDLPSAFEQVVALHQLARLEFLGDSARADYLRDEVIEEGLV